MRKFARILSTVLKGRYHLKCGHCNTTLVIDHGDPEEVDRINLDSQSTEVTYNFNCRHCNGENQLKTVIDSR